MKLLLVNPNTTASMTTRCATPRAPSRRRAPRSSPSPPSTDRRASRGTTTRCSRSPAMLDAVKAHPDAAGVVAGCFDDTGVDAARCVTSVPVIGICQAAMQVASIVSGSFTVVTTLGRSVPAIEHLARRYGYADLCRKVRRFRDPRSCARGSGVGRPRSASIRGPPRSRRGRLRIHRARLRGHGGHGPLALRGAGGAGGGGRHRGGEESSKVSQPSGSRRRSAAAMPGPARRRTRARSRDTLPAADRAESR